MGLEPPPTSATSEMVWCGLRKGRWVMSDVLPPSLPAMECICVVSRLSASVSGGMMVGKRLAIIDLPEPGGPMSITL